MKIISSLNWWWGVVNQGLTKEMKCEFIFFRDWAFETGQGRQKPIKR